MSKYELLSNLDVPRGVLDPYTGVIYSLDDPFVVDLPIVTAEFVSIGEGNYRMSRVVGVDSDNIQIAVFCASSHVLCKGSHDHYDYYLGNYFGRLFLIRLIILKKDRYA